MEQKKSKAFIITFIAIILLLVAAYFLFTSKSPIFGVKDSTGGTKKSFLSLFTSSKQKDLTTVDGLQNPTKPETNKTSSNTPNGTSTNGSVNSTDTNGSGSLTTGTGIVTGGGLGNSTTNGAGGGFDVGTGIGAYIPAFNPIPTPDGSTTQTPQVPAPIATPTSPTGTGLVSNPNVNSCPTDDPLVFTESEKTELTNLLKQYYLIAPTLRNADDIALIDNDITTNQALLDQANTLMNRCTNQKSSPGYTGPQIIKTNPYYGSSGAVENPYLPDFSAFEEILHIW
jgi:hypothetical protein